MTTIFKRFMNSGVLRTLTNFMRPSEPTSEPNEWEDMAWWRAPQITKTPSQPPSEQVSLPESDAERADLALADGLLDYFPNALAEVAKISKLAGDKHHPGEPLHWERKKSTDHRNKIMRHLIDSGKKDAQGNRHSGALAWRALALLQEELERENGYPCPRNAVD